MGDLGRVINKTLLPLGDKAILSRIIESFPAGMEFVVALGEKGQQVRDYLSLAHPDLKVCFVEVDNYDGPGSGPGYSILCCRHLLQRPFWFLPCDGLYTVDFDRIPEGDWVGVGRVDRAEANAYCNFALDGDTVVAIHDKTTPVESEFAVFTGLLCVRDYKTFWASLADPVVVAKEHQISNGLKGLMERASLKAHFVPWEDVGDREKYAVLQRRYVDYDYSKTNEFLYLVNGRVVKFFADERVVAARVAKANLKKAVFPAIEGARRQFYSYAFVPGKTFYAAYDYNLFSRLLDWLEKEVWTPVPVAAARMRELCRRFYRDKTGERLNVFAAKYPKYSEPQRVNGRPIPSLASLMARIPWEELYDGTPVFMHGDLQFDNILYQEASGRFCLLDWRQDFAGEIEFGDLYYDLAKLWGGINLNYDYIKAGLFRVEQPDYELIINFEQRSSSGQLSQLLRDRVIAKGLSWRRVQLLTGLIYLNMAPIHHSPFDIALMGLGRTTLMDVLEGAA